VRDNTVSIIILRGLEGAENAQTGDTFSRGCFGNANETFPRMETNMLSTEMRGVGQTSFSSYSPVMLELYYRVLQGLDQ
jgi:hypothetical protein